MEVFKIEDYRIIIRKWVQQRPSGGHGELTKMAEHLDIPTSVLSLTLSGKRDLSVDHAFLLAQYMGFHALEKEYFIILVQIERAYNHQFKSFLKEKKEKIKTESLNLVKRISHEKELSESEQNIFYSSWIYSAIRLSCDIGGGVSFDKMKQKFSLSPARLVSILEFLVKTRLIVFENSLYKIGPQRTYLERNSPLIGRHHSNWRIKAIEKASELLENELMFTSPLTCSQKDAEIIREKLVVLIQEISEIVKHSKSEELIYLGMDFIRV